MLCKNLQLKLSCQDFVVLLSYIAIIQPSYLYFSKTLLTSSLPEHSPSRKCVCVAIVWWRQVGIRKEKWQIIIPRETCTRKFSLEIFSFLLFWGFLIIYLLFQSCWPCSPPRLLSPKIALHRVSAMLGHLRICSYARAQFALRVLSTVCLRAFVSNVFKYALTSLSLSLSKREACRGYKKCAAGSVLFL